MKIEKTSVEALARRFGTPLYVYSKAAVLERRVEGTEAEVALRTRHSRQGP